MHLLLIYVCAVFRLRIDNDFNTMYGVSSAPTIHVNFFQRQEAYGIGRDVCVRDVCVRDVCMKDVCVRDVCMRDVFCPPPSERV